MSAGAVAAVVSFGMATIVAGLVMQAVAHRKKPRWWTHSQSYLGFAISGSLMASAFVVLGVAEFTNTPTLGIVGSVVLFVGALSAFPRRRKRQA